MSKRLLVEQKHTKAGIEFIKEGLEEFGIEKKQTIKTMLLVEEVLVKSGIGIRIFQRHQKALN